MSDAAREWHDPRVSQLYAMAITARYEIIRREILKSLGALERVGIEEAACAIDDIKKQTRIRSS